MEHLDQLKLNFSSDSLFVLNICLAIIMFGIALDIRMDDFKALLKNPKSALVGLLAQFIALPLLTFGLVYLLKPMPSIALGMMLVAACPGGNISNFLSHLSKSNTALSVSLTAIATVLSLIFTPLNLEFYASLYPPTAQLLNEISISPADVIKTILTIIALPLIIGIGVQFKFPAVAKKVAPVLKVLSIIIFLAFVVIAFLKNFDLFLTYIEAVIVLVFLHNVIALSTGYSLGALFKLSKRDCRTLAIETGIQNSGLGLVLIFAFFQGLGGMALVTAWWGIWHIVSGMSIAFVWARYKDKPTHVPS
jgi:BASS family bile acid:Na+ symporter